MFDVRYRLDERIAAGGVGQVWRGTDLLLQRPVAVKLLRPEFADHPETLRRFLAEARHAGALNHPCIAQVYDYCDGGPDTAPYLVMELVNGPSLADVLNAGPVGADRALDVIAQAAAGLAAAHRTGLVHRDIKPANILLSPDGLVKITDFGIAHAAGSASETAPQMVVGTAQYLAPERITGGPGGPASDLYSLGIVLHECLAGKPPFDGTSADVMAGHLYRPPPPLPSGIPPAIRELVARLTLKDPAARLADAAELSAIARRLRTSQAAAPSQAPTEMIAGSTRKTKPRLLVGAIAASVLAGFSGLLASGALNITPQGGPAEPGSTAPAQTSAAGTTPGTPRGGAASAPAKPGDQSPRPGPSPSPSHHASPAPRTSNGTAATPNRAGTSSPGPTPSSGSNGSGGSLPLPLPSLPVIGVSLGL